MQQPPYAAFLPQNIQQQPPSVAMIASPPRPVTTTPGRNGHVIVTSPLQQNWQTPMTFPPLSQLNGSPTIIQASQAQANADTLNQSFSMNPPAYPAVHAPVIISPMHASNPNQSQDQARSTFAPSQPVPPASIQTQTLQAWTQPVSSMQLPAQQPLQPTVQHQTLQAWTQPHASMQLPAQQPLPPAQPQNQNAYIHSVPAVSQLNVPAQTIGNGQAVVNIPQQPIVPSPQQQQQQQQQQNQNAHIHSTLSASQQDSPTKAVGQFLANFIKKHVLDPPSGHQSQNAQTHPHPPAQQLNSSAQSDSQIIENVPEKPLVPSSQQQQQQRQQQNQKAQTHPQPPAPQPNVPAQTDGQVVENIPQHPAPSVVQKQWHELSSQPNPRNPSTPDSGLVQSQSAGYVDRSTPNQSPVRHAYPGPYNSNRPPNHQQPNSKKNRSTKSGLRSASTPLAPLGQERSKSALDMSHMTGRLDLDLYLPYLHCQGSPG